MKIIYSNLKGEDLRLEITDLLELRQRAIVELVVGEKDNYKETRNEFIRLALFTLAYTALFLCILYFAHNICLLNEFTKILTVLLFWKAICLWRELLFERAGFSVITVLPKFFKKHCCFGSFKRIGYYTKYDRSINCFHNLTNRFCFGEKGNQESGFRNYGYDDYISHDQGDGDPREYRSLVNTLYYAAVKMEALYYNVCQSNDIQKMLKNEKGNIRVTVEKVPKVRSLPLYWKKFKLNEEWVSYTPKERSDIYSEVRNESENYFPDYEYFDFTGYIVTITVEDRIEESEDRVNLTYKSRNRYEMYLTEYEYRNIFHTDGMMDFSFADQKRLEIKESISELQQLAHARLKDPEAKLLECKKGA